MFKRDDLNNLWPMSKKRHSVVFYNKLLCWPFVDALRLSCDAPRQRGCTLMIFASKSHLSLGAFTNLLCSAIHSITYLEIARGIHLFSHSTFSLIYFTRGIRLFILLIKTNILFTWFIVSIIYVGIVAYCLLCLPFILLRYYIHSSNRSLTPPPSL